MTLVSGLILALSAAAYCADDKAVVPTSVRAADRLGGQRYAVIIGINDYRDPQIPDLKYAESDAQAIYRILTDSSIGGVETKHATLLLGKDATTRNIRKALTDLWTVPNGATVFVFFSGHGAKEAGEAFWVTVDSELGGLAYSAVPDREVRVLTGRIPSDRLLMLLDCCYAAATLKEQKSVVDLSDLMKRFTGKGRVTITASGSGEEAIEAKDLKCGVFAHYLVEGMRGRADGVSGPADGIITVPELAGYVDRTVAEAARRRKGIQKPAIFMEEVQEPSKFLVTIDPQRIAELETQARQRSEQQEQRLTTLKQMFIDEKINVEQYRLGKRLLSEQREALDEQDGERFGIFVELIDGTLPLHRLQALLDAIETPAQRAARLERERRAAEEARKRAEFDRHLSAARQMAEKAGLSETPPERIPNAKRQAAQQALSRIGQALDLYPDDPSALQLRDQLKVWTGRPNTLTLDLGRGVMMELVLIPAGEFMMGSDKYHDEKPVHRVRISKPFYLGKYEVNQAQWQAVMGSNPSHFKGSSDLPVEQVSWDDCEQFCRKVSAKAGREVRLPTEAEWEYACRAGSNAAYCFGDSESELGEYAWYGENSGQKTHAVGGKQANAWGLRDMHGNVWEWCADWYDKGYYSRSRVADPAGAGSGIDRVLRGGSWSVNALVCRSAHRSGDSPGYRVNNIGFRVSSGTH